MIQCINTTLSKLKWINITQLKWSQLLYNQAHILTLVKKIMKKILKLKLVILLEYQNIKTFFQKTSLRHGHMLLVVLMEKELLEHSMKKNFKK